MEPEKGSGGVHFLRILISEGENVTAEAGGVPAVIAILAIAAVATFVLTRKT